MSTLHLRLDSNSLDCVLNSRIAPNRIILASYQVRLPAAHGLQGISIDLAWLSSGVKTNNLSHRLYLPVSNLEHTIVSPALEMNTIDSSIPQVFHANIYSNSSNTLVPLALEVNIQFTYID
jgi:hypothetical protein